MPPSKPSAGKARRQVLAGKTVQATIESVGRLGGPAPRPSSFTDLADRFRTEQPALHQLIDTCRAEHGDAVGDAAAYYGTLVWAIFDRAIGRPPPLTADNLDQADGAAPDLVARQPALCGVLRDLIDDDVRGGAMTASSAEVVHPIALQMVDAFDAAIHAVAAPAPAVKPKGRKRAIVRNALVAFVVIGAWIGALVWWQSRKGEGYAFRKETQELMEQIRDGKAHEVYEQATPELQGRIVENRFLEKAALINQTLGEFKGIKSTHDHGIDDSSSGRTGYVSARLEFARAETTVSLGWKWDEEAQRWRLLSYHFDIPQALRGEVPAPELAKPKREAPSEVVELTRTTLERIRDGKAAEVYAGAHKVFKGSVDLQRFLDLIDKRTREMGKYVRIIDFTKTGKNERERKAWVTAVIEYTRAKTTGTFDFIHEGDDWQLAKFKIDIPPPEVPTRPQPEPLGSR